MFFFYFKKRKKKSIENAFLQLKEETLFILVKDLQTFNRALSREHLMNGVLFTYLVWDMNGEMEL